MADRLNMTLKPERMKILTGKQKKKFEENFDKIQNNQKEQQDERLVSSKNGIKTYKY